MTNRGRWHILLTVLVTPKRDRIAERRAGVRQEILEAAWQIAREKGLVEVTLREVAGRVGMKAPSLYSHFESKNAIYDGLFGQAWQEYDALVGTLRSSLSEHPRTAIKQISRHFFEYAAADLPRHQLMSQRIIPGFEPSAEAYAPSVRVLERSVEALHERGVVDPDDVAIWVALIGGLVNQHHANDPGGDRYSTLLEKAVDMWADAVGLPAEASQPTTPERQRDDRHHQPHQE